MSRFADPLVVAVASARRRNFHAGDGIPDNALDFDDPVDRLAAIMDRLTFAPPDGAAAMSTSPFGQTGLAHTWSRLAPERQQLLRRRAGVALEFAVRGSELRSRPEENAA